MPKPPYRSEFAKDGPVDWTVDPTPARTDPKIRLGVSVDDRATAATFESSPNGNFERQRIEPTSRIGAVNLEIRDGAGHAAYGRLEMTIAPSSKVKCPEQRDVPLGPKQPDSAKFTLGIRIPLGPR